MSVRSRIFLLATVTCVSALALACPAQAAQVVIQIPGVTDVGIGADQDVSVDLDGPIDANLTLGSGEENGAPPQTPPATSPGSGSGTGSGADAGTGSGAGGAVSTPTSAPQGGGQDSPSSGSRTPADRSQPVTSTQTGRAGAGPSAGRAELDSQAGRAGGEPAAEAGSARRAKSEHAIPNSPIDQVVRPLPAELRGALVALALACLGFAAFSLVERRRRRRAEQVASVDPLTGVASRLAFEHRLAQEWSRSQRYGNPLGVLLIDLDDFKLVNDRRGHTAGDCVLREVAQQMQSRLRETDMLARFGGDEFAVICPETSKPNLATLARSLERHVRELADLPSVSIGIAEYEPRDAQPLDIIERADNSMYETKRSHLRAHRVGKPLLAGADR